ncbi:unnamed protein product [Symbiodinium microadriaticum]|nr:unnamed protein product [Symbiodinium microadriaticum]
MHNLLNNTVSLQRVGDACATLLLKRELKQTTLRSCGGSSLFLESASSAGFFAPEAVEILKFKKGYPEMLLDQHPRQAAVPAGLGALAAALDSSGPAATGVLSERDQVSVHPSAERKNVGSLSWPTCCASSLALAQEKLKKELASKEKDLEKTPKANRIRTEQMAAKAPKRGKLWERSFLDDRAWAYLVSASGQL